MDGRLQCIDCDEWLLPAAFHRDRSKKSGRGTRCKACSLARHRAYYTQNRDRLIAQVTARREVDLDAARTNERRIYRRRRAKHQATNLARERRMERPCAETVEYDGVLRGDPCSFCGGPADQVDHIEPIAADGRNHWTNLTAACRPCNRAKSDKPLLLYLATH